MSSVSAGTGARDPDKAAARALQWGMPILESSIALIDGERLYYRGHDAVALSRSRSVAEVASLIWSGRFDTTFGAGPTRHTVPRQLLDLPFLARAQSVLAGASAGDPFGFDLRPDGVASTGWRIQQTLTRAAVPAAAPASRIELTLARAWGVSSRGVDLLRGAILCADHGSTLSFTARALPSATLDLRGGHRWSCRAWRTRG